jgi:hypothetical protein
MWALPCGVYISKTIEGLNMDGFKSWMVKNKFDGQNQTKTIVGWSKYTSNFYESHSISVDVNVHI